MLKKNITKIDISEKFRKLSRNLEQISEKFRNFDENFQKEIYLELFLKIFVSRPIRRYSLINVSTYDFKTFEPVPLPGLNSRSKM